MTTDDLERILSSDDLVEPSSGFASGVMRAVRQQAAEPPPLPFPWGRFLTGLAACGALAAAATDLAARIEPTLASATAPLAAVAPELGCAALAVLVSLGISRLPRLLTMDRW